MHREDALSEQWLQDEEILLWCLQGVTSSIAI